MAAARTLTIKCAECGRSFRHTVTGDGGRPPKYCPAHQPKNHKPAAAARGRAERRGKRRAEAVGTYYDSARLAVALRSGAGLAVAGKASGLADELEQLEQEARAVHKDLVANDSGGRAARIHAAIDLSVIATTEAIQLGVITPRDLPNIAMRLAFLLDYVGGKGKAHNFTRISAVFKRPEAPPAPASEPPKEPAA